MGKRVDKLECSPGKGEVRSPWHVLPGVMESTGCVLGGGVEFNPQKSPVRGPTVGGETAITSMHMMWLNSAGPMAKVWDTRSLWQWPHWDVLFGLARSC